MDSILVSAAYDEVYGENASDNASEETLQAFFEKNYNVLQEAEALIPEMAKEALKQTGPYDPEPYEVFLLSAPQHVKHKLKRI